MNIGERLRELRLGNNMTLLEVREKTGLSVSHLSDMERGRAKPSFDALGSLALCYGITMSDLMAGVDPAVVEPSNYPAGLRELVVRGGVSDEWAEVLSRIEFRGKRPTSIRDWELLHTYLRTTFEKDETTK